MPAKKREEMKRKPPGQPRQKLKVEGMDESRKYYWATEDQFRELQEGGYRFERNDGQLTVGQDEKIDKGTLVSRPASRQEDKKLYLMSIDKKWYAENQSFKQKAITEQETEIFNRDDTDTTYAVKGNKKDSTIIR